MNTITVETLINAPVEKVWQYWNEPAHITKWAFASDDWESPSAENNLVVGGKFKTRMQAKDGSVGFDFEGTYAEVAENELIKYEMADGRKVEVHFEAMGDQTSVIETFDPETENSEEMQRAGWQAILDNFKKYVESDN